MGRRTASERGQAAAVEFHTLFAAAVVEDAIEEQDGRFSDLRTRLLAMSVFPSLCGAELASLRWGDVLTHPDRVGERLRVRGARPRTIAVSLAASFVLSTQARDALSHGRAVTDEQPIFPRPDGRPRRGRIVSAREITMLLTRSRSDDARRAALVLAGLLKGLRLPAEMLRWCIEELETPRRFAKAS